jgi:hypothetical protein
MGALAPKHRVSSEALTDEGGGGAQRRVVDGVTDARNYFRIARPEPAIVNELFGMYCI